MSITVDRVTSIVCQGVEILSKRVGFQPVLITMLAEEFPLLSR